MTGRVYELDLPLARVGRRQVAPGPPLHANQRLHWSVRHRLVRLVRHTAHWRAKQIKIPRASRIAVGLHYAPGSGPGGTFDPSNLMPTQKAALDGVRDAGVVPDDSAAYVVEEIPAIHTGPGPRRLWLRVEILED